MLPHQHATRLWNNLDSKATKHKIETDSLQEGLRCWEREQRHGNEVVQTPDEGLKAMRVMVDKQGELGDTVSNHDHE